MEMLVKLLQSYPKIAAALAAIGALRLVVKPIMAVLRTITAQTPTPVDDEALANVEHSKLYLGFLFVLDWLASIKR